MNWLKNILLMGFLLTIPFLGMSQQIISGNKIFKDIVTFESTTISYDSVAINTVAHMLIDTLQYVFGLGNNNDSDSLSYQIGAGLGGWFQIQDTVVWRVQKGVILGGESGDSIVFGVYADADGTGNPSDTILTASLGYDSGAISITTFNEIVTPPNMYITAKIIWVGEGTRPKWAILPLCYSEKRNQ